MWGGGLEQFGRWGRGRCRDGLEGVWEPWEGMWRGGQGWVDGGGGEVSVVLCGGGKQEPGAPSTGPKNEHLKHIRTNIMKCSGPEMFG